MKIGIVNDVSMAAEALRRAVTVDGAHEVIWSASNGREAVERSVQQRPDLVLMDLIMPEMDGVEATRRIMERAPCAILVVTSSVREHAALVFAAMGCGALDATNTPILGASGASEDRDALLNKIRTLEFLVQPGKSKGAVAGVPSAGYRTESDVTLVAIGASCGGPTALTAILRQIDVNLPVPIVVIQHVDSQFAREFAWWLGKQIPWKVDTVKTPVVPAAGTVYVAERDNHLVMDSNGMLTYADGPLASFYRPSVDVFFDSVRRHARGRCVAILLTGMGRDGAEGLLRLRLGGHVTVAQDRATSAVYGMPRAATENGGAAHVLPLGEIGAFVNTRVRANRRAGRGP